MLVVAVLWAAAPAFACMLPATPHSCCAAMPDCSPAMMGTDSSCCQMHAPQSSDGPAAAQVTTALTLGGLLAHALPMAANDALRAGTAAPAQFPSPSPPRSISVLRI